MQSNNGLERLIKRRIQEYDNLGYIEGFSQEEIFNIASGLKRKQISPEEMQNIGREAEMHFRERLKTLNEELFSLYILLKTKKLCGKEAKLGWKRIGEGVDEQGIKQRYIDSQIAVNSLDIELVHSAIEKIIKRNYQERLEFLKRHFDDKSVSFIMNLESKVNQINYPNIFNESLGCALKNKSPFNFEYLLCLRYMHEKGNFGVADNLEPFSFYDVNGNRQIRDGSSKKFQLDSAMELKEKSRDIKNILHRVIVMDTDLGNFIAAKHTHKDKIKDYVNPVRDYVKGVLEVISASEYFEELGFDNLDYANYINMLLKEDTPSLNIKDYIELLKKNYNKVSRTLKWDKEQNDLYTASSIARNIVAGRALSERHSSRAHCVFNKNASIGSQFNVDSASRILFLALPIYGDNIGSIEHA